MSLLYIIELFGVMVFAMAGAIEAARKRFDLFGVLVLAFISALGGGTVRDLLLDRHPLAWVQDINLAYLALVTGVVTFMVAKFIRIPFRALLYADAVGLAAFTVSGTQVSLEMGLPSLVVILMGMASGIFGGIIRDLMANEVPLIFRKDIYATATLAGAVFMVLAQQFSLNIYWSMSLGFACVVTIRFAAIHWHLSLPNYLNTSTYRKENHPEDL